MASLTRVLLDFEIKKPLLRPATGFVVGRIEKGVPLNPPDGKSSRAYVKAMADRPHDGGTLSIYVTKPIVLPPAQVIYYPALLFPECIHKFIFIFGSAN